MTEEVAALEDENRRLSEVIQADQPNNEELLLHVKELQHVGPTEQHDTPDIMLEFVCQQVSGVTASKQAALHHGLLQLTIPSSRISPHVPGCTLRVMSVLGCMSMDCFGPGMK